MRAGLFAKSCGNMTVPPSAGANRCRERLQFAVVLLAFWMALRISDRTADQRQDSGSAAGQRISGNTLRQCGNADQWHSRSSIRRRPGGRRPPPSFAFIGYIAIPQCLTQSPTSRPVRTTAYFTIVRRHTAVILRLFASV